MLKRVDADKVLQRCHEIGSAANMYCPRPSCGAFVDLDHINVEETTTLPCPSCMTGLCLKCKSSSHIGPCQTKTIDNQMRQLADANGWKECPKCHHLIELKSG